MLHLPPLIRDLAIILVAAALMTFLFKKIKQPVVLGYILAGLAVGPKITFLPTILDREAINIWAEIGVIFLLFGLGLEFSFKKLSSVGGSASVTAMVEVVLMLVLGHACGKWLGWSSMDSLFLGAILCVSSTTIIIRAFDELGMKTKKYATLVFGALIVEDLITIILLVLLSTISISQKLAGGELIFSVVKLVFFLLIWFVSGIFLIPSFLRYIKNFLNDELLLVTSVALCLAMVFLATYVGFSPALGAFVMGSILSETIEGKHIEHLIQPVKDLFGAIFFVSVGILIDPQAIIDHWQVVIFLSAITIGGKIFSTTLGSLLSGQTIKDSVQSGMALAQIGEFSFIIASLGLTLKVTSDFLYPLAVAVSVVTTFTTPYMIKYSAPVAGWLEKNLPIKAVEIINNYSSASQTFFASKRLSKSLKTYLVKQILLTIIVLAIAIFTKEMLNLPSTSSFILSFALSAPFLIAIARNRMTKDIGDQDPKRFQVVAHAFNLFQHVIVIALLAFEISYYFSTLMAYVVFLFLSFVTMFFFSRKLVEIYQWIEKTFIHNLNQVKEPEAAPTQSLLTPWDAHLAQYTVRPDSPYLGKGLEELSIREIYGVSIVMIERGKLKITAPKKDEKLYPFDKISVIGTDEHLSLFKAFIDESIMSHQNNSSDAHQYELRGFRLTENSVFVNKTIRESGIRELTDGLVVGLERNSQRILNPDSLTTLKVDDFVWIVGIREKLAPFMRS